LVTGHGKSSIKALPPAANRPRTAGNSARLRETRFAGTDIRQGIERSLELPNGMVLVTGPTGSGKTTTLYTGLLRLNTVARNA
jgi:type II secretory ATPase GspE/PulE/Tfp pilus assembly ATPase PilB-like protein